MKKLILTALLATLPFASGAETYPSKPLQLIVPFAAGGASDIVARALSVPLSAQLGQPVVVVNKPGAGAMIGAAAVAKSPADGYTMLLTSPGPQITNPYLMDNIGFDPQKDLASVSLLAQVPSVLVVHKDVPVANTKELISYAKANPKKLNFSSSGVGSASHLSGEQLKQEADIDIVHVPYRGSGAALTELLAGQVQMAIDSYAVYQPYIESGQLRALAVATRERLPQLPDVPTISEDLKGFDSDVYLYITVRGGTPAPIVEKLSEKLNVVLQSPEIQTLFTQRGLIPRGSSPAELTALVSSEASKWKKVIEISGAKIE